MTKQLIVDVDEVLLDWLTPFKEFVQKQRNIVITDRPKLFNLTHWLKLPIDDVCQLIQEFNDNHNEFTRLTPIGSSEKVLPLLYEQGFVITAISACSANPQTAVKRQSNL